ncbi:triose-phosphate isomerase [Rhodovibrio sodomensis]|uniref:Triosephosphate isomerase n=1 Tax=Rhodovibrio sodomensis TaxID=1088 RepID=A0ABS1DD53_9PROT|nr:triose-phosphate isomerase [Rhodovibrio sodomensis]MBK1668364.1 triose-phosphate isomerase [Rhodovibrio sodomensis]
MRKLIAGNWKMNGLREDGTALAKTIAERARGNDAPEVDWLVCPPFTLLHAVADQLAGSPVRLGAQDCHYAENGAHTGDVAPAMLRDLCCSHVIVGHSERRQNHGETNELVQAKAEAARAHGMTPILCIGETQAERDAGRAMDVLTRQLEGSLPAAGDGELVIAYEPVWAIGTGRTATADDVRAAHAHVRAQLKKTYGEMSGAQMRILYGGSVKPANAGDLMATDDVNGALVGGASLKPDDFWRIGEAAG